MKDENIVMALADGEEPELNEWEPGEMEEEVSGQVSEGDDAAVSEAEPDVGGELLSEESWRARERERDFLRFAKNHPEVSPDDIPDEVWRAVAAGSTLSNAWRGHQNTLLRVKLLSMEQAEINRRRSTGSRATQGAGRESDYFDAGWGEM